MTQSKYTKLYYDPERKLICDASATVNCSPAEAFYTLWCYVTLGRKLHEDWYVLAIDDKWNRRVHEWAIHKSELHNTIKIGCKYVREHELLRIGRELGWEVDPELWHKLAYVPSISHHASEYRILSGKANGERMLPIKGYAIDLPEFPCLFVHPTYHGADDVFDRTLWSVSEARTGLSVQAQSNRGYITKQKAVRAAYKRLLTVGPEKYAAIVQTRLAEMQRQQKIPLE